jgi:hypothetical protein
MGSTTAEGLFLLCGMTNAQRSMHVTETELLNQLPWWAKETGGCYLAWQEFRRRGCEGEDLNKFSNPHSLLSSTTQQTLSNINRDRQWQNQTQ